jgi:FkbM family methyltransferase
MNVHRNLEKIQVTANAALSLGQQGELHVLREAPNGPLIVQFADEKVKDDWIILSLVLRLTRAIDASFHVHLDDDKHTTVCTISSSGEVLNRGVSERLTCAKMPNHCIALTVCYYNFAETIHMAMDDADGTSTSNYDIISIDVELDRPAHVSEDRILSYIDVGARWGRSYELKQERRNVRVTMFEPDPDAMALLEVEAQKYPGTNLVQKGLYSANGLKKLYITAGAPCSSLLLPNQDFLRPYAIGHAFEVEREIMVECARFDTLYARNEVSAPDAIKIDVQGAEFEVLDGFGALLENCIGIELESHLYPVYCEQMLLTDITKFLHKFDLMLVRLIPQDNFDGHLIEFNAWFLKKESWIAARGDAMRYKLQTLKKIWFL